MGIPNNAVDEEEVVDDDDTEFVQLVDVAEYMGADHVLSGGAKPWLSCNRHNATAAAAKLKERIVVVSRRRRCYDCSVTGNEIQYRQTVSKHTCNTTATAGVPYYTRRTMFGFRINCLRQPDATK